MCWSPYQVSSQVLLDTERRTSSDIKRLFGISFSSVSLRSREEEQVACLLFVVAEKQDITQRPGGGEEAGLDYGRGSGGLCAL